MAHREAWLATSMGSVSRGLVPSSTTTTTIRARSICTCSKGTISPVNKRVGGSDHGHFRGSTRNRTIGAWTPKGLISTFLCVENVNNRCNFSVPLKSMAWNDEKCAISDPFEFESLRCPPLLNSEPAMTLSRPPGTHGALGISAFRLAYA